MKSVLVRSFAVAMLASSISAFAATAPSKDDSPKEEKMSMACGPADASGSENPTGSVESNLYLKLDQLEKEVHQLAVNDKLNQEEKQKANQQEKNKIRQQNKQWNDSLLGIYG